MGNRFEAPPSRRTVGGEHEYQKWLRRTFSYHLSEDPTPYTPPDHKPVYYTGPSYEDSNRFGTKLDLALTIAIPPTTLLVMGISPGLGLVEAGAGMSWMVVRLARDFTGKTLLPVPKLPHIKDIVERVIKQRRK